MQIKSYTITTVVALLAAGCMGIAASVGGLRPVANNNARTEALNQIVKYLKAENCLNIKSSHMPEIGTPIDTGGDGKIATACLYYPRYKRFAYIGQLGGQLQIVYLYTNTEVRKANGSNK